MTHHESTGWVQAYALCYACGRLFGFNPQRVPSIVVKGQREPVCRECVELANPERVKRGLELIAIRADAYEPLDANEL